MPWARYDEELEAVELEEVYRARLEYGLRFISPAAQRQPEQAPLTAHQEGWVRSTLRDLLEQAGPLADKDNYYHVEESKRHLVVEAEQGVGEDGGYFGVEQLEQIFAMLFELLHEVRIDPVSHRMGFS